MTIHDTPLDPGHWDDYVRRATDGTFFHLAEWSGVVERTFGHRPVHLHAIRNGAVAGLLPLFHVRSPLFGSMLVSTPNAVNGGPVADDPEVHAALLAAAKQKALAARVRYLELRYPPGGGPVDPELPRKDLYFTFDQPIDADEDALLRRWPSDIRRMIRLGVKHGFACEVGREEFLPEFYQVYATALRALGTPVFPRRLFAELLAAFPHQSDILIVRHGRRVAAAVLSFYFGGAVLPYYAGAYGEFYRHGINNYIYWELMRHAARRGCTQFDFGRSKAGTGAYAFKRGWRMTERPLPYRYFLVRSTRVPNLSPSNPRFDLLIRAWKRLPLNVTMKIGPLIVKHLP